MNPLQDGDPLGGTIMELIHKGIFRNGLRQIAPNFWTPKQGLPVYEESALSIIRQSASSNTEPISV